MDEFEAATAQESAAATLAEAVARRDSVRALTVVLVSGTLASQQEPLRGPLYVLGVIPLY